MPFPATLNGRSIEVRVGYDGQLWHWVDGDGQHVLANSGDAAAWIVENVAAAHQEEALRSTGRCREYRAAWVDAVISEPARTGGHRSGEYRGHRETA